MASVSSFRSSDDIADEKLRSQLESEDGSNAFLLPSHEVERPGHGFRGRRRCNYWFWVIQTALFLSSFSMFLYTLLAQRSLASNCMERLSAPSPALNAMRDEDYEMVSLNSTLGITSDFVGPYSETTKALWDSITEFPLFGVSEEDMIKAGASLDSVKFPEEAGGGYLAMLEGTHALHCLRKFWEDHHIDENPEAKEFRAQEPKGYEAHLAHCLDYMRQNLMCSFDASLVTFNWLVDIDMPFPYFGNPKKCRNFESFRQWSTDNKAHKPAGFEWVPPEDAHYVRVVDRVAQWDEPWVDRFGREVVHT